MTEGIINDETRQMKKIFLYYFCILLVAGGCKEKFNTDIESPATGYLVVEGFISSGAAPTSIKLSRTVRLVDSVDVVAEHNARVTIEDDSNTAYPLTETGNGVYTSESLTLNNAEKYHLHILTQAGKEYISEPVSLKQTPDIDSVSWTRNDDGVTIHVSTHDDQSSTKYYKWDFTETWEFHSAYYSSLLYSYDQFLTPSGVYYRNQDQSVDTTIYKCWNTVGSTTINLGSSEKLSENRIYLPLLRIEPAARKLSVLYSIDVRQYALSRDAYFFYQKIKKNTENVGTIFDAQPSDIQGNIHAVADPSETVIGFVDVSEIKQQRLFIKNSDLPGWNYQQGCAQYEILLDSIKTLAGGTYPTVPTRTGPFGSVLAWNATQDISCIDCTITGTNVRPSFWP